MRRAPSIIDHQETSRSQGLRYEGKRERPIPGLAPVDLAQFDGGPVLVLVVCPQAERGANRVAPGFLDVDEEPATVAHSGRPR